MNGLQIIRPGWHATIQDAGRIRAQQAGLTEGGAADEHAYRWANKLLDNPPGAACVEVLMGQFEAVFDVSTMIAVTGADLAPTLNGRPIAPWSTLSVRPGDRIVFERPVSGLRAYLAVLGGWQTPVCFGSRTTVVREGLGGLDGGALKQGDWLPCESGLRGPAKARQLADRYRPDYRLPLTLKLVPGYQYEQFSALDRQRFIAGTYTVSQRIDRMGYRLEGPAITPGTSGVISEGIALGAVQFPRDGQPIVLLRDRQTIGGYPKIGCVSSLSCSALTQRGPGARVHFEFVSLESVQADRLLFNRYFDLGQWQDAQQTVSWP